MPRFDMTHIYRARFTGIIADSLVELASRDRHYGCRHFFQQVPATRIHQIVSRSQLAISLSLACSGFGSRLPSARRAGLPSALASRTPLALRSSAGYQGANTASPITRAR